MMDLLTWQTYKKGPLTFCFTRRQGPCGPWRWAGMSSGYQEMILFIHILSGILLTLACCIWYFTEESFVLGTMIFLFSVLPINLYVLFTPKEGEGNSTVKKKVIGSTLALALLGTGVFIIVTNKEDYFMALFKNSHFLGVFWLSVICGIVASYRRNIMAQRRLSELNRFPRR